FLEIVVICRLRPLDLRTALRRPRETGRARPLLRQLDVRDVAAIAAALQDDARVDAEEEHQPEQDQKADNADAAATTSAAATTGEADGAAGKAEPAAAFAAPVLDVLAFSLATPAHRQSLQSLAYRKLRHCAWDGVRHKVKDLRQSGA